MKKVILVIAVVLTATIANAQLRVKGAIELAPQIGYSSSNYFGGDAGSLNNPVAGVAFGITGDYFFNNRWSIRSGLLLQKMGTEVAGFEDNLSYVTIPVNANWHFGSTRKWYLNFGPSLSILTSAKNENGDNIKDFFKTTQIGLNVGIGYKIEVAKNFSVLIDYQGVSGLTDIIKDSEFSTSNNFGSFNVGGVFKI
ncbi:porin family protein [Flavobacterium sp. 25HG05S-40]|uniref:porin family protein n=1 Tax=Flavobacterium sp. 25HG05S-40 TaxID=3458682 RepID=UPI00404404E1